MLMLGQPSFGDYVECSRVNVGRGSIFGAPNAHGRTCSRVGLEPTKRMCPTGSCSMLEICAFARWYR